MPRPTDRSSRRTPRDSRGPSPPSAPARTPGREPPSRPRPSFPEDRFRQLPETDRHTEEQTRQEKPGRRAPPVVDQISDAAKEEDASYQRVARRRDSSGTGNVLLEGLRGALERRVALRLGHEGHGQQ